MWRCINRITMEPFYFALFFMEIFLWRFPILTCLRYAAWPHVLQGSCHEESTFLWRWSS